MWIKVIICLNPSLSPSINSPNLQISQLPGAHVFHKIMYHSFFSNPFRKMKSVSVVWTLFSDITVHLKGFSIEFTPFDPFDPFWPILTRLNSVDPFWNILTCFDLSPIFTHFHLFSTIFTTIYPFSTILTHFVPFWAYLTSFDQFRPVMTLFLSFDPFFFDLFHMFSSVFIHTIATRIYPFSSVFTGIGDTIPTRWEIQCLPYEGFFLFFS